jgi:dethiobiotin synthetase
VLNRRYFVLGAGTDIGKTYVTALLVRQARAAGQAVLALKPVASGVPSLDDAAFASSDTSQLLEAQGLTTTPENIEACSPWRFRAPLSPDMAAAVEGRSLTLTALLAWIDAQVAAAPDKLIFVEGVGGVMSPMTSDALNLDVAKALGWPAILVTGSYLGALSHALTAIETLKAHGVEIAAVVLNESADSTVDFDAMMGSLSRFAPCSITRLERAAQRLDVDLAQHRPPRRGDAVPAKRKR